MNRKFIQESRVSWRQRGRNKAWPWAMLGDRCCSLSAETIWATCSKGEWVACAGQACAVVSRDCKTCSIR